MSIDNIEGFITKSRKYNRIRLILGIFMIVFAFPTGKFFSRSIKNMAFNNPQIQEMFQTYKNIKVTTEEGKKLKKEIVRLVATVRSALIGVVVGTSFLITLTLAVGGITFLGRYFSDRKYLKIIEKLYNAAYLARRRAKGDGF